MNNKPRYYTRQANAMRKDEHTAQIGRIIFDTHDVQLGVGSAIVGAAGFRGDYSAGYWRSVGADRHLRRRQL